MLVADLGAGQTLHDYERQLMRARAVLVLRRRQVPESAVERAMRRGRFLSEARGHAEGAELAPEAKLHAALDADGDDADEDVKALVDLLSAVRGGGGVREAVAGRGPKVAAAAMEAPPGLERVGGEAAALPASGGQGQPAAREAAGPAAAAPYRVAPGANLPPPPAAVDPLAASLQSGGGAGPEEGAIVDDPDQAAARVADVRGRRLRRGHVPGVFRGDGRLGKRRARHERSRDGALLGPLPEGLAGARSRWSCGRRVARAS